MPTYAINKKAKFDFEILATFEAGIQLFGFEVKSIREGHINLKGAYLSIRDNELWLINAYVSQYSKAGTITDYDPERPRKLLVHRREIAHLQGKLAQKGLTLMPLKVYNSNNRIKISFGLAKGKKKHDKRETIKDRDVKRDIQRRIKENR